MTEHDQFYEGHDAPASQPAPAADTMLAAPSHDHDDGLVHGHRWAMSPDR